MKRRLALFAMTVLLLCAGMPAHADNAALPPALQALKDGGATVDFIGHAYGLDGWRLVPKNGGDAKYAYVTPEGGFLLGVLLNPDGTNATALQLKALKEKLDGGQNALPGAEKTQADAAVPSLKAEKLYAAVEKSGWARAGDEKAPYLYLFINTLCDHCQALWKDLEGPVKAGKLQVRIVPFGKLDANRDSGAALLSVDDPVAAWDAFIRGDQKALAKDKIKPGMAEKVDANTALFRDWDMQGPPFTIYRKPSDGQITVVAGQPENLMLVLADLTKG